MKNAGVIGSLWVSMWVAILATAVSAQQATIVPQVRTKPAADSKITAIELAAHFVTAIRVPEPVNSVVVGDPVLFQVEHSEHEPELVFVKALTNEHAESNLLISTARGRQISFLLVTGLATHRGIYVSRNREGKVWMAAGSANQLAFETSELKHGIFTYYLLAGLSGQADLNRDGLVTVDELFEFVSQKVVEASTRAGLSQRPWMEAFEGSGDFVMAQIETSEGS